MGSPRKTSRGARGAPLLLCIVLVTSLLLPPGQVTDTAVAGPSRGDGNDSFDTAAVVQDEVQTPPMYLDAVNDTDDFFWIQAERGEAVDVHFIILQNETPGVGYDYNDPAQTNFDLEIYGPLDHEKPLTYSRTTDQFEVESLVAAVAGKYHFRVHAVSGRGNYALMADLYDPPEVKDGDVVSDKYVKQNSNHDADWYKVRLEGGNPAEAVRFTMTHQGGNLDLFLMDLWCRDRPHWLDVSWDPSTSKEVVYGVASYTGYYYLKVHAFSGYSYYSLKVEVTEEGTDNDNDKGHATVLDYNATWSGSVHQALDKYDYFEVALLPQEELSVDLVLHDGWGDIFSVFLLDVGLAAVVEVTNYIFEPQHGTGPDIELSEVVEGGVYFVVVMAKVALKPGNPDDLSDDAAAANYTMKVNMSKHAERPPNRPPEVRPGKEGLTLHFDEDTTYYLDLDEVFVDPDGDQMTFDGVVASGSGDITVSVDMSGTVTIIPRKDWHGSASINFTAEDAEGGIAWLVVGVDVRDRPEPPIFSGWAPASEEVEMAEGEALTFHITVTDGDTTDVLVNWSVDGLLQGVTVPTFEYTPGYEAAGPHTVRITAYDGTTEVDFDWDVMVTNTNRAPVISSLAPANGSRFKEGAKVTLAADISDPDGDTLSFEWKEGVQPIGMGTGISPTINHTFAPGKHTLRLTVTDPFGGTTFAETVFRVDDMEEGPDWGWLLAGVLVALLVAFIIYAYAAGGRKRRRRPGRRTDAAVAREIRTEERRRRDGGKKGAKGKGRKGKRGEGRRKRARPEEDEALDEAVDREVRAEERRRGRKGKKRGGRGKGRRKKGQKG